MGMHGAVQCTHVLLQAKSHEGSSGRDCVCVVWGVNSRVLKIQRHWKLHTTSPDKRHRCLQLRVKFVARSR